VATGRPAPPDPDEPRRVAESVAAMKLEHVVITMVTRDDLPDGGARAVADTVVAIRGAAPDCSVEVLVSDMQGDREAIRIITDSVKNCYAALGFIHQKLPHFPHRFRDLISMPKPNLYQALHTTIITENKQTAEIQIRTRAMHNMAENGISAHWKYKEKSPRSIMKEDARLHWLREMVDLYKEQKSPKEFLKNLKINLIPEEIYVFTPKGKVVTLPAGASVLDFAFKIHSEIGLQAKEAIVNGKKTPLKTLLKTGDMIEIITSPEKRPSRDWLSKASTSKARHHIKHWFKQQDKEKNSELGKKLWEKKIKEYKLPAQSIKKEKLLRRISEETT
jgi:GTP pyrophosphokinase